MKNIKAIVCVILVLALSICLVVPAMAANEFVPSITYKQSLVVKEAEMGGDDVLACIVVSNVKQAREATTDITQEARDLLIEVYEAVVAGEMQVPVEEGFVLRELVDISFMEEGCVQKEDHNNKPDELAKEDTLIKLVIEMGLAADAEVAVYAYIDGEWVPAEEVANNGNGTINVSFEDLCPVAIAVK